MEQMDGQERERRAIYYVYGSGPLHHVIKNTSRGHRQASMVGLLLEYKDRANSSIDMDPQDQFGLLSK